MTSVEIVNYDIPWWVIAVLLALAGVFLLLAFKRIALPSVPLKPGINGAILFTGMAVLVIVSGALLSKNHEVDAERTQAHLEDAYRVELTDDRIVYRLAHEDRAYESTVVTLRNDPDALYEVTIESRDGELRLWVSDSARNSGRLVPFQPGGGQSVSKTS